MAEDTRRRPEFSNDYSSNSPRESANDPLAELARLIGQSDPYIDGAKRGAQKTIDAPSANRPAPEWLARPASHEHDEPEQHHAPRDTYVPPPADHYDEPAHRDDAAYHAQPVAHDQYAHQPQNYRDQDAGHYQADDQYQYENDGRYGVARPTGDYESDDYDGGHLPPQGGESGGLPSRRRNVTLTIAAVLGLAVIGTAGAFGYRALTSGSTGGSANPPVIKADTTPAKTVPAAAPAPAASADNKPFQDRIGAPGATATKLGPTEEQPVSLPMPPPASRTTSLPSAQTASPLVPPAPTTANEPKRVKTMVIRQDAAADGGLTAPAGAAPGAARAPAPNAKQPQSAAPIALTPPQPATPPQANTKVAARTPPAQAAGGAYVVQVSAQRTEAEAQSSYASLQSKYPSVLSGRTANIKRVDLGDKGGVFYRAQVGSFATSELAAQFCNNLRDVGGQCIVQKN